MIITIIVNPISPGKVSVSTGHTTAERTRPPSGGQPRIPTQARHSGAALASRTGPLVLATSQLAERLLLLFSPLPNHEQFGPH